VSVCLTPAAPSPLPIPYPITGNSSEGVVDQCMRTKINGSKVLTVGSVFKACHGNEPGTLKEVVSLNTGGPCFIAMGAPTVFVELGMAGITGSPGFGNKAVTVGGGGSASNAAGANAGGGSGGAGSGGNGSGSNKQGSNSGGSGGKGSSAASGPTPEERKLAAEENAKPNDGKNAQRVAARKKVSEDFMKKHGKKWDPDAKDPKTGKKGCMRSHTDAERASELKCIDHNKPVKTRPPNDPPGLPPLPNPQYCVQAPDKRNGQYYSSDPKATPSGMGIGKYGTTPSGDLKEKDRRTCVPKSDTPYMESTAAPCKDTWSGRKSTDTGSSQGVFTNQEAKGGEKQNYIPDNSQLTQTSVGPL